MPEAQTEQNEKAFTGLITQQAAQYVPLSNTPGQACANCRWFKAWGNYCHLVEEYPEPILATGWSNRWEASAVLPELVEVAPIPVVIVDVETMALPVPKNLLERVKAFIADLGKPEQEPFMVFKAANGKNAWIARYTGKWIDRENEIIADAAHNAYVARVQSKAINPPELWMWHNKATKHGQAVTVWKAGGFTLAAGYFDETPVGNKAFAYYQKNRGKIKLSHMFHYPQQAKIDGVYHELNTIEITTLPDGAEAFPYTSFEEIQTMALPEVAQNMISEALGADVLAQALAADNKAEADSQKLDGAGIASKGLDQYPGSAILDAAKTVSEFAPKLAATETRLAATEQTVKELADLPAQIKQLSDTVKTLAEQLQAALEGKAAALEQVTTLEKRVAELTDLQPPGSKAEDTLLSDREKSLVDSVMQAAKSEDQQSLVEKLVGVQPAITTS